MSRVSLAEVQESIQRHSMEGHTGDEDVLAMTHEERQALHQIREESHALAAQYQRRTESPPLTNGQKRNHGHKGRLSTRVLAQSGFFNTPSNTDEPPASGPRMRM